MAGSLRGRERELAQLAALLQDARLGSGSAALIVGEGGAGKTRLLDELVALAQREPYAVARANADEIDSMAPLSTLLRAFADARPAVFTADQIAAVRQQAAGGPLVAREVQSVLERVTRHIPVLIAIDDVDVADELTVYSIRRLVRELISSPVTWLLTARPSADDKLTRLRSALSGAGGSILTLVPVGDEAVGQIVEDLVGAPPDPPLADLARAAGGNVFLLTEVIEGAVTEGVISIRDGIATLTAEAVPRRLDEAVRTRLAVLSTGARNLLEIAAVVGRSFRLDDVLALVNRSAVQALPAVRELIDAGVIAEHGDVLVFRHDLIRRSVLDGLSAPLVALLHRDVAQRLLDAGAPPEDVAGHLLAGADMGDDGMVRFLVAAADRLTATAPEPAAALYRRAVELSAADRPRWLELAPRAGQALIGAGDVAGAQQLFEQTLAAGPAPDAEAAFRADLSEARWLTGQYTEAIAVLQPSLDRADISPDLRARLSLSLARALVLAGHPSEAIDRLDEGIRIAREFGDVASLVFGLVVKSYALRFTGAFAESLQVATEATLTPHDGALARLPDSRIYLARSLMAMDRLDDADRICLAMMRDVRVTGDPVTLPGAHVTYAWLLLARGHVAEAVTEVEAGLAALELSASNPFAADLFGCAASALWLAGDDAAASEILRRSADHLVSGAFGVFAFGEMLGTVPLSRALVELPEDAGRALGLAAPVIDQFDDTLAQLVRDPAHGPGLVRVALAGRDLRRARRATDASQQLAAMNPTVTCWQAAAEQAAGLLSGNVAAILGAAETFAAGGRALAEAMALADAARLLAAQGDPKAAAMRDRAAAGFTAAGADGAAARLAALATLPAPDGKTRPAHKVAGRPAFGWDSLTAAESRVVALAATGATNKEIAERLWLSPYTVDTHMRHVFAKLGLRSRVALARVVAERGSPMPSTNIP